jgi:hypothetical protein
MMAAPSGATRSDKRRCFSIAIRGYPRKRRSYHGQVQSIRHSPFQFHLLDVFSHYHVSSAGAILSYF